MTHPSLVGSTTAECRRVGTRAAGGSPEPMSTQTPHRQTGSDRPAPSITAIRAKAQVGTDAQGREHYWCSVRQTLYVLDGDVVAHAEEIRDRPLEDWVAYIEEHVGWDVLYFSSGSIFDALAEVFE